METEMRVMQSEVPDPIREFKAVFTEYNAEELESRKGDAYGNLARNDKGELMPHCFMISLSGGELREMFNVEKESVWIMEVFVFSSNGDMKKWIEMKGEHCISDVHYVIRGIKKWRTQWH